MCTRALWVCPSSCCRGSVMGCTQPRYWGGSALGHAASGVPVFPRVPRAKVTLTPSGFYDATTDPEVITAWRTRHPQSNVATPTGSHVRACCGIDGEGDGERWTQRGEQGFLMVYVAGQVGLVGEGAKRGADLTHLGREPRSWQPRRRAISGSTHPRQPPHARSWSAASPVRPRWNPLPSQRS